MLKSVFLIITHTLYVIKGSTPDDTLPRVTWGPGIQVREGDTVLLKCQIDGKESVSPAIWIKLDPLVPNGDEIISHGEMVIQEDNRITVAHNKHSNFYVLTIKEVSPRDAGRYQCQVPVTEDGVELRGSPPVTVTVLGRNDSKMSSSASSVPSFSLLSLLPLLYTAL